MRKRNVLNCVAVGLFCLTSTVLFAASPAIDECSKELLLAYFPETFVTETLKKFNVPQDKWDSIKKELNSKDKDVIKTVEQKASQINPNPLKDPQQRQAAVKIFRETLLQIFGDVLKANGITDQKQIQSMLDDIQQQKAKRFAQCMERHKTSTRNNDDDSDDDDDDDDDDDLPDSSTKSVANQKRQ